MGGPTSAGNYAVLILVLALQAACVFKSFCAAWTNLIRCLRRFASRNRPNVQNCERSNESPEVADLISKLLVKRRLQCSKFSAFYAWVCFSILSIQIVGEMFGVSLLFSSSALPPRLTLMVALSVPGLFPGVLNGELKTGALYLVCMGCLCAIALGTSTDCSRLRLGDAISTAALLFGGLCPRFRWLVAPNICLTGCRIFAHLSHFSEGGASVLLSQALSMDIVMLTMRLVLSYWGVVMLELLTRKEVEASFGTCQQSAVSGLLGMTCDAVIELDEAFRVNSHCPKLAAMLMHSSSRTLSGQMFFAFVFDEADRARLQTALQLSAPTNDQESLVQGMLQVGLRDSIGNKVATTLFHVPYISASGQMLHLIGLREETDEHGFCADRHSSGAAARPESVLRPEVAESLNEHRDECQLGGAPSKKGSRSRSTGSSRSKGAARRHDALPSLERSAEVLLVPNLPAVWLAEQLQLELDLAAPCAGPDGGILPSFGAVLADGGVGLLNEINSIVDHEKMLGNEGSFTKVLGEWDLVVGSTGCVRRKLWISFNLPLCESGGMPYVCVSVTHVRRGAGRRASRDLPGTSAMRTPGSLGRCLTEL